MIKDHERKGGHVVPQNEAYGEMKNHPKEKGILHINTFLFLQLMIARIIRNHRPRAIDVFLKLIVYVGTNRNWLITGESF